MCWGKGDCDPVRCAQHYEAHSCGKLSQRGQGGNSQVLHMAMKMGYKA